MLPWLVQNEQFTQIQMLPLLNRKNKESLAEQIYHYFRREILELNLPAKTKMPSLRILANDLGVSINTVLKAYNRLSEEGYLLSKNRAAYIVVNLEQLFLYKNVPQIKLTGHTLKVNVNYSDAQIDIKHFPFKAWRRVLNLAIDSMDGTLENYEYKAGLNVALAKYLYKARGVKCNPLQIRITAGTNSALIQLALLLKDTYTTLLVENPGYDIVRNIFQAQGYKIIRINVGAHGIDVEAMPKTGKYIVYLTPSHQYPTGVSMPISRRISIINWAQKNGSLIIEDDYDSEFRYRGKPIPSLQSLDSAGNTIYLGTFSKSLIPNLRVSYVVLPDRVTEQFKSDSSFSMSVAYILQRALALFIEDGYWERHLRKMKKIYSIKYFKMAEIIRQELNKYVKFSSLEAGLYFYLIPNSPKIGRKIKEGAFREQIYLSVKQEEGNNSPFGILLGFAGMSDSEMHVSAKRIKRWIET